MFKSLSRLLTIITIFLVTIVILNHFGVFASMWQQMRPTVAALGHTVAIIGIFVFIIGLAFRRGQIMSVYGFFMILGGFLLTGV